MSNRLEQAAMQEIGGFFRPLGKNKRPMPAPNIQRADELLLKTFDPIRWAIKDILPEGVTLLVGAPKVGKSWLALQFGIAIGSGTSVWAGRDAETAGDVLILGLEDNDRRMQSRIAKLRESQGDVDDRGHPVAAPDVSRIHFATQWPRMDQGGLDHLETWLREYPDARLIIIDTLGRFRAPDSGRGSAYQADYEIGAALKPIADSYKVAIALLHHTRKQDASDVLDTVSGTQGLTGSVDALLVLRRERGQMDAALYVTGRDIEHELDYALQFNADACTWLSVGTVHEAKRSRERTDVLDFVTRNGPSKPKDIAEGLNKRQGTIRKLLHHMFKDGEIFIFEGLYSHMSPLLLGNGGNGRNESSAVTVTRDPNVPSVTAVTPLSREDYRAAKDGE